MDIIEIHLYQDEGEKYSSTSSIHTMVRGGVFTMQDKSQAVGKDPNALGWNLNVSAPFAVERMFFMTEICTRQWHFLEDTTIRPIRR
ncbi:MAG: hypothetical protein PHX79_01710 [Sphaerochaetaceae bacterium]|nr:hypothetical protein [Sphaerochaetaceae bacterium]